MTVTLPFRALTTGRRVDKSPKPLPPSHHHHCDISESLARRSPSILCEVLIPHRLTIYGTGHHAYSFSLRPLFIVTETLPSRGFPVAFLTRSSRTFQRAPRRGTWAEPGNDSDLQYHRTRSRKWHCLTGPLPGPLPALH